MNKAADESRLNLSYLVKEKRLRPIWDTEYEIGEYPKMKTDYTFHSSQYYEVGDEYPGSLNFIIDCTDVMSNDYDRERTYHGLQVAMKELYDETEPGTENSKVVYLKDYVEYYTFGLDVQLPGKVEDGNKNYHNYSYLWINGNVIGMGESSLHGGSGTGDIDIPDTSNVAGVYSFSFRVFIAFEEDGCYMTFDPRINNDNVVDVSRIPGGFGIYHFCYDKKEGTLEWMIKIIICL